MPRLIVEPVSPGPQDGADGDLWLNTSTLQVFGPKARRDWPMAGEIGAASGKAKEGKPGKSAYELAVENGFVGSLDQWLRSLKGATYVAGGGGGGTPGPAGVDGLTFVQVTSAPTTWGARAAGARLDEVRVVILNDYADDVAAAASGIPVGGMYRTGNVVKVRLS